MLDVQRTLFQDGPMCLFDRLVECKGVAHNEYIKSLLNIDRKSMM